MNVADLKALKQIVLNAYAYVLEAESGSPEGWHRKRHADALNRTYQALCREWGSHE